MTRAIAEITRRRERQMAHNAERGFTPITVISGVKDVLKGVTSRSAQGLLPKGRDPNKRGRGNALPGMDEEGAEFIGMATSSRALSTSPRRKCTKPPPTWSSNWRRG